MSTSKLRLEGKVAIITGAASGIGEASARLFAANGAKVVIADIEDQLGQDVAASIGQDKCSYRHCDVADEKQVEETVAYAVATYGRLDIMFSNAGVAGTAAGVLELDKAGLERAMSVNLGGAVAAVKHSARAMIAGGVRGSIVCTTSVAVCWAGLGRVAYTVSKHALLGLARCAAGELGAHGIRVNCLSPFGVGTKFSSSVFDITPEGVEESISMMSNLKGLVLKTNHIADAALFLASDDSVYISGQNLVVDGGTTVVCPFR